MKKKSIKKKSVKKVKVVLKIGEVANILKFYGGFDISIPGYLAEALGEFITRRTSTTQETLKTAQLRAMVESTHPAFKDKMFKPLIKAAKKALEEDLNKELNDVGPGSR